MRTIITVLFYLWQLPQNLLGLVFVLCYGKASYQTRRSGEIADYYFFDRFPGGISLGRYILLNSRSFGNETDMRHEYGHTRQSVRLGWLYLFVVGLPSLIHAWLWPEHWGGGYYDFWTERWADKLGPVNRDSRR